MPDFQPISEVMYLLFPFSQSCPLPFFVEYSACPSR
jgi:hypothetical protein